MDTALPGYAHAPAPEPVPYVVQYGPWAAQARPLTVLGVACAVLFAADAALALVSAVVSGRLVLTYAGTSGLSIDSPLPASTIGTRLAVATAAMTLLTALVFLPWLFRASRNLGLYGVRPRRSPGWAIGAWFVPVLSLWWPKQVVDDVVRGSRPGVPAGVDVRYLRKSGVVAAWWASWLLSGACAAAGTGVVMVALMRVQLAAASPDLRLQLAGLDLAGLLETQSIWSMWSGVLSCLAATCAAVIVLQTTADQRRRRRDAQAQVDDPWAQGAPAVRP